ncbi:MAG: hypothetical protein WBE43_04485, partial [Candidatus Acidiferrales bacterium]
MRNFRRWICSFAAVIVCLSVFFIAFMASLERAVAQQVDPSLYSAMRWRLIGPYRAGRVTSVAGIPGDASTYYFGTPGGGVWKTTDGGVV